MSTQVNYLDACGELVIKLVNADLCIQALKLAVIAPPVEGERDVCPMKPESNTSEMVANLTIAHRHLEDAIHRVNKSNIAYNGNA